MKYLIISILLIAAITLLSNCANIQSPPGGPGDTTAPYIAYTYPETGKTNFDQKSVNIKFDGYMNRAKVVESINITPNITRNYDWSAKTLTIEFTEDLQENTTYVIYLGTDYTDYYNNAPKESYNVIFSTGNKLDSGRISGKLFAPENKGKYIFAYKIDETEFPDPREVKPDYSIQTGSSGDFEIVALKPGKYRLFAVDDKFKDQLYNKGTDAFGTPAKDIVITEDNKEVEDVKIYLGPAVDETGPGLISVMSEYDKIINVTFDENIDQGNIQDDYFEVTDKEGNNYEVIDFAYNTKDASMIKLLIDNDLEQPRDGILKVNSITDSTGNVIQDTLSQIDFVLDTLRNRGDFNIKATNFNDSTKTNVTPQMDIFSEKLPFKINFSKIPDLSTLKFSPYFTLSDMQIPSYLESNNLKDYFLVTENPLEENMEYQLHADLQGLKDIWGYKLADTVFNTTIKTGFFPKYSSIRGTITDSINCEYNILVNARNTTSGETYNTIAENKQWSFDKVTPGKYIFEIICDEDNNGEYSFGSIIPFKFREKYSKSNEFEVQENWEYKDIELILND